MKNLTRNFYVIGLTLSILFLTISVSGQRKPEFKFKATPTSFKQCAGTFRFDSTYAGPYEIGFSAFEFNNIFFTGMPFKKGFDDMIWFNYGEYIQSFGETPKYGDKNLSLSPAIQGYALKDKIEIQKDNLIIGKISQEGFDRLLLPFYFRRYEVTNKEYKQFLEWVKDHNGYAGKTMYTIAYDTFAYKYFKSPGEYVNKKGTDVINVYPKENCWSMDFLSFNEDPMTQYYFTHPAYDDYPVVGLSYWQALAYLDWKTHFFQAQLDLKNIPLEVEFDLPSEIEWEIAASSSSGKHIKISYFRVPIDRTIVTDLSATGYDAIRNYRSVKNLLLKDITYKYNYMEDGYFFPGPANLKKKQLCGKCALSHYDELGISWMDGNVSEWMKENYQENWSLVFTKYLSLLNDKNPGSSTLRDILVFMDTANDTNGKMVKGCNWIDERFAFKCNKNIAGMSPKVFVNPDSQHSTIGFRYVLRVKPKVPADKN